MPGVPGGLHLGHAMPRLASEMVSNTSHADWTWQRCRQQAIRQIGFPRSSARPQCAVPASKTCIKTRGWARGGSNSGKRSKLWRLTLLPSHNGQCTTRAVQLLAAMRASSTPIFGAGVFNLAGEN